MMSFIKEEDDPMEDIGPLNLTDFMIKDEFDNDGAEEPLMESKYNCNPCNISMRNESEFLWHHTAHCTYPQIRLTKLKTKELPDHTHKRRPMPLSKLRKSDLCTVKKEESAKAKIKNNKKLMKVINQLVNPNTLQIPSNIDTIKIIQLDKPTTSNQKLSSEKMQGKVNSGFAQMNNLIHLDTSLLKSKITKYSEQTNANKIDDNSEKPNPVKSKRDNRRKRLKKKAAANLNIQSNIKTSVENINLPINNNITSKTDQSVKMQDLSIQPPPESKKLDQKIDELTNANKINSICDKPNPSKSKLKNQRRRERKRAAAKLNAQLNPKTSVANINLPIDKNMTSKPNQSVIKSPVEPKILDKKIATVSSNSVLPNKQSNFVCTYPECNLTSFPSFNDYGKHLNNIHWNPQTSLYYLATMPDNNNTKKLNIKNPTPCQFLPNSKIESLTQNSPKQCHDQVTKSIDNHYNNKNIIKPTKQEINYANQKVKHELFSNVLKPNSYDLGEASRNVSPKGFNPIAGNKCQKENRNSFNGIKNKKIRQQYRLRCPNWPCNRSFVFKSILNTHLHECPYGRRYVNQSICCQYCFQTFVYRLDFENHLPYCMHFNQNYYYNYQPQPYNHFM